VYPNGDSFTIDANDEHDPNNSMEACSRTWKMGMDLLCRDYNLPDNGFLIYGESRGAQWAHRLVLRNPKKFLAVHININSSFEEPTPEASHCLWLVTTGELEPGSQAARIFYRKSLACSVEKLGSRRSPLTIEGVGQDLEGGFLEQVGGFAREKG
jgi:hypothetical protein